MKVEQIPADFVVIEDGVEKCITLAPAEKGMAGWKLAVRFLDGGDGYRFFPEGTEIHGQPCNQNKAMVRRWKTMS
jgi:hypothetical protein